MAVLSDSMPMLIFFADFCFCKACDGRVQDCEWLIHSVM
jgi:hypothetical protein